VKPGVTQHSSEEPSSLGGRQTVPSGQWMRFTILDAILKRINDFCLFTRLGLTQKDQSITSEHLLRKIALEAVHAK
jgi:hypothetical protein